MSKVTELVYMKTALPHDAFTAVVEGLERNFHTQQPGFLDTELLYDEKKNTWVMVQHWESAGHMKAASARMFKESATQAFRDAIDPKAIEISVLPLLGRWEKDGGGLL